MTALWWIRARLDLVAGLGALDVMVRFNLSAHLPSIHATASTDRHRPVEPDVVGCRACPRWSSGAKASPIERRASYRDEHSLGQADPGIRRPERDDRGAGSGRRWTRCQPDAVVSSRATGVAIGCSGRCTEVRTSRNLSESVSATTVAPGRCVGHGSSEVRTSVEQAVAGRRDACRRSSSVSLRCSNRRLVGFGG